MHGPLRCRLSAIVVPLAAALASGAQVPHGEVGSPPPLHLRVNRAIARGVLHLREKQGADGRWVGNEVRYPGGLTAFTAYTLVKSGVRRSDADLAQALDALETIEPRSTYGASARLLLYASLRDRERWKPAARGCLRRIVSSQRRGLWGYPEDPIDLSNVQFALMGLWAAREMGLEVPERTLVASSKALCRLPEKGGGFRYRPDIPVTAGITAGTLCGLALLERFGADHPAVTMVLRKHRRELVVSHAWLAEHWSPEGNQWGPNAWTPGWHYPHLWAVERTCELTGLDELGGRDWYAEGAEWLVAGQKADGGFGTRFEDTCFALLFLRRTTFSGGSELAELYEEIDAAAADRKEGAPTLAPEAAFLTDWLVTGPFLGKPGSTGLHALPFAPERVRVREHGRVGKRRWERIALAETAWTNLEKTTDRTGDHCIWLLATLLTVAPEAGETQPVEALLWFAFEDGWRVFLDGAEISSGTRVQAPITPDVIVPVSLGPGRHELLVVAEDAVGAAAFGARISDPDGGPLPDRVGCGLRKPRKGR